MAGAKVSPTVCSQYPRLIVVIIIETFGEDHVLTAHLGVAYCQGLSKDGKYSDEDAVIPVPKVGKIQQCLHV